MRTFFSEKVLEKEGSYVNLSREEEYHLFKVLRAKEGMRVKLLDGKGDIAYAELKDRRVVIYKIEHAVVPSPRIHLFFSVPRKNKLDMILSQCTELGVFAFHPIQTERSVAVPNGEIISQRWKKIIIESIKQSGNPFLPEIHPVLGFSEAIEYIHSNKILAFAGSLRCRDYINLFELKNLMGKNDCTDIGWIVGPEGGFSHDEEEAINRYGYQSLRIAEYTLRVETAAVAGVMLLKASLLISH